MKKLENKNSKRVIIKEEIVELVRCFCYNTQTKRERVSSNILNTVIVLEYFLDLEERRLEFYTLSKNKSKEEDELSKGWISKSASEISVDTMLELSESSIMKHIEKLETIGVVSKRHNWDDKGDRRFQYHVNILRLRQWLFAIGYALAGWPLLSEEQRLTKEELMALSQMNEKQ